MTDISGAGTGAGGTDGVKPTETPLTHDVLGVTADQFTKFYNADTKAYNWQAHAKESEFKLAQKDVKPAGGDAPGTTGDKVLTDGVAKDIVQDAGLDFDVLEQKIRDKGDIETSDYDALVKIGLPEDTVRNFIRLMKDEGVRHTAEVTTALGGSAGLQATEAWAMKNLSADERAGYDNMLNSPQWPVAVDALRARMGQPPVEKQGVTVQTPNQAVTTEAGSQPFSDQAAMTAAIQDPKYKTDPAYRAVVSKRAAASTWEMRGRTHPAGL